jgi:hypothetical protein
MNTNQSRKWLSFLLAFGFIFFMACNEDGEDVTFTEDEQSAYEAEESTENLFDVVESITNSAISYSGANAGGRVAESVDPEIACAAIVFSGDASEGRVEINFGTGCQGPDGKVRKGSVVVEYVGNWLVQGSLVTTILKDFYVDGVKVEGTRAVTSLGYNDSVLTLTVKVSGGKVTWPDGTFLTRSSTRTHKLTLGQTLDDIVLEVTGEAAGITLDGIEYASEIVEPLVFKAACRGNTIYLPVSGIKTITIPELPVLTVDYGEGDCDNKFMIILDRGSKEITL